MVDRTQWFVWIIVLRQAVVVEIVLVWRQTLALAIFCTVKIQPETQMTIAKRKVENGDVLLIKCSYINAQCYSNDKTHK